MRDDLTALLITWNEAPNIGRTLERLSWIPKVLIVDSGSDDETLAIASRFPNVTVLQRPFDHFANQMNFGLDHIQTGWVLGLDADWLLSEQLVHEIQELRPAARVAGYRVRFIYCIHGRPLRGSLYPPRTILFRRQGARYRHEGHGHRVEVGGPVADLRAPCFHDDRKPLSRWFRSQQRYAALEAQYLLTTPSEELNAIDRLRRGGWATIPLVIPYTLFVKRCILNGLPGWHYALQRLIAEAMIALELADRRLDERDPTRRQ